MKRLRKMTVLLVCLAACGDEASDTAGDGGADPAGGGGSTPAVDPYAHLYACEEVALQDARPLSGPGYDVATGFVGAPQSSYVIHTTQIYVRPEQQAEFFKESAKVMAQMDATDGVVAYTVALDQGCGVARTMGVWISEEAIYAFVGSGAHAAAMQRTTELSFTGKTTTWDATQGDVLALGWDVAREKLDAIGTSEFY